jgi:hypothetical protein
MREMVDKNVGIFFSTVIRTFRSRSVYQSNSARMDQLLWALLPVPIGPVSPTSQRIYYSLGPTEVQTTAHQSSAGIEEVA